jgi:prevent-host-death family protein
MIRINIADVKAHLSRYLEAVEGGETIVICRRNVPIAEIRPLAKLPEKQRPVGIDRGMTVPPSFFEPLPDDLLDAFEGGEERA